MPFNHERFKNVAAGIQSIGTVVGIIVAGGWVLYTFWSLGVANKARAEITTLEHSAVEQPVLQIDLQVKASSKSTSAGRHLSVTAKFMNEGKRAVEFQQPTLLVKLLAAATHNDSTNTQSQTATAQLINDQGELVPMPPRVLRAGQARMIAFLITVPSPGEYLLQVRTTYTGLELRDGDFQSSSDEKIDALEQGLVDIQ